MRTIRFVSQNPHKAREVQEILSPANVKIATVSRKIDEIQTENVDKLIRDKLLKAFAITGRPVFVEHTGLYLNQLNNLPGGLTQIFWDNLEADNFSRLFGNAPNTGVIAKTVIGYCDGKKIHTFIGEIAGNICSSPQGPRDFQWDCVFTPKGEAQTFAQMGGEKKNAISMRKKAFDSFIDFLNRGYV